MSLMRVRNPESASRFNQAQSYFGREIPGGVYFHEGHDNFYFEETQDGMDEAFYQRWRERRYEFPQHSGKLSPK